MLINSLKQEICQGHLEPRAHDSLMLHTNSTEEGMAVVQEYAILQAQYEELQREYSGLYSRMYTSEKENVDKTRLGWTRSRQRTVNKSVSSKNYNSQMVLGGDESEKYGKLRVK